MKLTVCMMMAFLLLIVGGPVQAKEIVIGSFYPMSGGGADLGKSSDEGARLAVKEINAKGGVLGNKIKILTVDSQAKPDVGAMEAKKYIMKDKVDFLLGGVSSSVALAVSELAKEYKKIYMVATSMSDRITKDKGHRYVFRAQACNSQQALSWAVLMAKQSGAKTWAVTGPDYEYGHNLWDVFIGKLKQLRPDVTVVRESWPKFGEPNYTSYINAVMEANPDAVFTAFWGGDLINFIKQAKPYGFFEKVKFPVITGAADLTVVQALKKDMPDNIWCEQRYYFHWPETPRNRDFVNAYQKEYGGKLPAAWAASAYDGVYYLARAIEKAKSTDTEKVVDALEGLELDAPRGKSYIRKCDHQNIFDYAVGRSKWSEKYGFAIAADLVALPGNDIVYTCEEAEKARKEAK
jgi:branched-chain amino acid transport system substrate-binding protein